MGVVTQLLVRYQDGYTLVNDLAAQAEWGIKRGFLQLGSVTEADEVTRIGQAVLGFQSQPRVATTLAVEPDVGGGNEPYVNYGVGDTITAPDSDGSTTAQRVVSVTVVEDDQGDLTYANELKASFLVQAEALDRQLKKLLNGTMSGTTQSANNIPTGSVTKAENGDSIGSLRTYTNGQLLKRAASAHTSTIPGIGSSGGTFTPGTDQELYFDYSKVYVMGASGFVTFSLPDGGFPTGLLNAIVQCGDNVGTADGYYVTIHEASCSKTQLQVLVVNSAGTVYPNGNNIRLNVRANGW